MGTSTRASNPVYGVDTLLRKHQFHDFFIKDVEFDVSRTQFICQVADLDLCPRRLLQDMDVIVEL